MILELQKGIIYGPVNSRRLGKSLGINILPPSQKACPFNCVYCQYGWTKFHKREISHTSGLPSVEDVKEALTRALTALPTAPAYITFSGNGEPTVHPAFDQILEEITDVRNHYAPQAKTAILSNSALVSGGPIRESLIKLDVRIMKLDCGHAETYKRYNQPCPGISLEEITEGLIKLSGISEVTIQTLMSSGLSGNLTNKNIIEWIKRLTRIKPASVQLYTLDRGYPAEGLKPATKVELDLLKIKAQEAGIAVHVF